MKPEPLVKMANQIAASVPDRDRVPAETAAHLRRFWTPGMIDILDVHARQHPDSVRPEVLEALESLRPEGVLHG